MINWLKTTLLAPLVVFRLRYLPLLLIYFAYGLSGFSAIALTFWQKEQLGLSAEQLLAISAWAAIPWTAKVVVGQFVDCIAIFGSRRRVYIFIGAALMTLGSVMLAGLAGRYDWVMWIGNEYTILLLSSLLTAIGFMVQDVTADTMTTEVVPRTELVNNQHVDRDPRAIQAELASVQVLGRISLYLAIVLTGGLVAGWLATNLDYENVFWLRLVIPVISCLGAVFVRLEKIDDKDIKPLNPPIFWGGVSFIFFSMLVGTTTWQYKQEIVFLVSAIFLSTMLWLLIRDLSKEVRHTLIFTLLTIFLYRSVPSVGPGVSWWTMDVLGFDQAFFGVLAQIGSLTGLLVLWLLADKIGKGAIRTTLIVLIIVECFLFTPDLLLYYDMHTQMGVDARTLALFDAAAESPLVNIAMVIMLSLIAFHAPAGSRGTWFAVAASFMNLALAAGSMLSKYLNKIFVVSREVRDSSQNVVVAADYSELGLLLWTVLLITFSIPMLAVLFLLPKDRTNKTDVDVHENTVSQNELKT